MRRSHFSKSNQRGVTLLELLIVVGIVALISSFAYPSYVNYIVNTKRTAGTAALLRIADRQQQFYMDNKTYADDLTDLGFPADPYIITDDGTATVAKDRDAVYTIALSNVAATTYTITATPLHGQLSRDTKCAKLTLDQAGARAASTGSAGCW